MMMMVIDWKFLVDINWKETQEQWTGFSRDWEERELLTTLTTAKQERTSGKRKELQEYDVIFDVYGFVILACVMFL